MMNKFIDFNDEYISKMNLIEFNDEFIDDNENIIDSNDELIHWFQWWINSLIMNSSLKSMSWSSWLAAAAFA